MLDRILEFIDKHDWIADPVAVILTGALASYAVVWQVGKQSKSAITQQQENARLALKVELYRHFENIISHSIRTSTKAGVDAMMLPFHMRNNLSLSRAKIQKYLVNKPADEYSKNNLELEECFYSLILLIEHYLIVNPRLDLFRHAFNSCMHDIRESFTQLWMEITRIIPAKSYFELAAANDFHLQIPTDSDIDKIELLAKRYSDHIHTLGMYMEDMSRELQKEMLGDLFENSIPLREPLNKSYKVIRIDDVKKYRELKYYFENHTAWGKSFQKGQEDYLQGRINME